MYVSTVKYDTSHERKSTCVLGYWELPNHRVLSNSVTDAVPYVGRDTAAVSLPPSLDRTELKKGRKKTTPLLADRGCTHSRPNGTNQHRVEEKKTLIRHICLCSRQANEKLFPEVTCIRTKRLGVILVSLTLFHCCLQSQHRMVSLTEILHSLFSVTVNKFGRTGSAGEHSAVRAAQQHDRLP